MGVKLLLHVYTTLKISAKKNIPKVVIVTALFVLFSCSPVYVPNVVNTPMLSSKHEFQAGVYSGIAGVDPQFSYAITNNWGVMLNGSFTRRGEMHSDNFRHQSFVELGSGFFNSFSERGVFEFYGGGGYGVLQSQYTSSLWKDYNNVELFRFFLQPSVGLSGTFADISFASRFVFVQYVQSNVVAMGAFAEPVVTARVGYKYLKAVMQFGVSLPIVPQSSMGKTNFQYQPIIFSAGIHAIFNKQY